MTRSRLSLLLVLVASLDKIDEQAASANGHGTTVYRRIEGNWSLERDG
jgi:hypothetical protein